jgi:hypothetical protein
MTILEELNEATDEEFTNYLKQDIWKNAQFEVYLDETVVDRSNDQIGALLGSIKAQMIGRTDADELWLRRAGSLSKMLATRKSQTRRTIKELNRLETGTVQAVESKWSAFAESLAEVLEEHDCNALDRITMPDGSITAAEWLTRRRAQQALKLRAAA